MLYRVLFDSELLDQWFLDTPVNASGDQWAFWRLLEGRRLVGADLDAWSTRIKQKGKALAWSFAGFDIPIVSAEVAELLAKHAPDDVQLPIAKIDGLRADFRVLVAVQSIACVSEDDSEFTCWTELDGRPEKTGQYRMFTRLRLNTAAVPKTVQIFRVAGWQQALVVRKELAEVLKKCVGSGLVLEAVA